jgi:hypothetical protein
MRDEAWAAEVSDLRERVGKLEQALRLTIKGATQAEFAGRRELFEAREILDRAAALRAPPTR